MNAKRAFAGPGLAWLTLVSSYGRWRFMDTHSISQRLLLAAGLLALTSARCPLGAGAALRSEPAGPRRGDCRLPVVSGRRCLTAAALQETAPP